MHGKSHNFHSSLGSDAYICASVACYNEDSPYWLIRYWETTRVESMYTQPVQMVHPVYLAQPIRLLIVDDHPVVRKGLSALIEQQPDIVIVGEAQDGFEAVQKMRELHPDVVLLDLVMPGKDGIAAISEMKAHDPQVRILVITSFIEDEKIITAIQSGVHGCITKDILPTELIQAIRDVYAGKRSIECGIDLQTALQAILLPHRQPPEMVLSRRELDVLRLVARGLSDADISEQLHITARTSASHISRMLHKLQLENRTQLALYALHHRLVSLYEEW